MQRWCGAVQNDTWHTMQWWCGAILLLQWYNSMMQYNVMSYYQSYGLAMLQYDDTLQWRCDAMWWYGVVTMMHTTSYKYKQPNDDDKCNRICSGYDGYKYLQYILLKKLIMGLCLRFPGISSQVFYVMVVFQKLLKNWSWALALGSWQLEPGFGFYLHAVPLYSWWWRCVSLRRRMQKQAVLERIMNVRDWGGIHNKTLAKSEKKPRLGRSRPGEAIKEWEGVSLR